MFPVLFLLWIILNGRVTLEILIIGAVLSVGLELLACRMLGHTLRSGWRRMLASLLLYRYLPLLLFEMLRCACEVLLLVLQPGREVAPQLQHFRTDLKNENMQVLLADSVTLTPGTITVELKDGRFLIHALDKGFLTGFRESALMRELERLEKKYAGQL